MRLKLFQQNQLLNLSKGCVEQISLFFEVDIVVLIHFTVNILVLSCCS
jgi:hypothetical protein